MTPAIRFYFAPTLSHKGKSYRKGAHGYTLGRVVFLDPRSKANLVNTIIHETLHVRHPSWSEHRVLRETSKRSRKMTWKQKAHLLRATISRCRIRHEEED